MLALYLFGYKYSCRWAMTEKWGGGSYKWQFTVLQKEIQLCFALPNPKYGSTNQNQFH